MSDGEYFKISDKLRQMHEALDDEHMAAAFVWWDKNNNSAHAKAVEDLNAAILEFYSTMDLKKCQTAIDFYFSESKKIIDLYKNSIPKKITNNILGYIKGRLSE